MTAVPLLHVLFFIAAFFAPRGATQITVTGPDQVSRWDLTANGWEKNHAPWSLHGTTIVTHATGKPPQTVDVSRWVATAITHDWQKEKTLTLSPHEILEKTDDGFILRGDTSRPSARVYRIAYGTTASP